MWMDLEMTGLDPEKDRILEVAVIATDWQFNVINQMTAVVKVPEQLMKERMVGEIWERNRESYEALVSQNEEGRNLLMQILVRKSIWRGIRSIKTKDLL